MTKFVYVAEQRVAQRSARRRSPTPCRSSARSAAAARRPARQTAARLRAQLAQAVRGLEGLDRADVARPRGRGARTIGLTAPGLRGEEGADRGVALGDPGPLVQQRRRLGERAEVDLRQLPAERARALQRVLPRGGGLLVAAERQLVGARDGDPRPGRAPRRSLGRDDRRSARVRIVGIGPGGDGQHALGAEDVGRQQRDAVEAAAGGHDAALADRPERRLEADDAVEGGRHPPRAGGVGPERERDRPVGDDDGRAGARAARDVARIDDAGTRAVRRPRPRQAGRELVHVRLADRDRTGGDQAVDDERAARRGVRVGRAGRRRRRAREVDVVLDRERHAVQRQIRRGRPQRGEPVLHLSPTATSEIQAGPVADRARS